MHFKQHTELLRQSLWFGFLIVCVLLMSGMSHAEKWSVCETGNVYVSGSADGTLTKIPTTKTFQAIEIHPVSLTFTASEGSTIVANADFWIANSATLTTSPTAPDYWAYSQSMIPWRHSDAGYNIGVKNIFGTSHNPVYVGNTPTAATSGSAANVGQTVHFETWTQDGN